MRPARILHVGNLVNYGFRLVTHLRQNGLDAYLLMNPSSPRLSHPSAIGSVPSWVIFWKSQTPLFAFLEIARKARSYDLVHSYYTTVIPMQFTSTPYVFHAMGSDLRENAMWRIRGWLMRRAIRKARVCICSQADLLAYYDKLGVKVHVSYPPIDTEFYSPAPEPRNKRLEIFHPAQQDWEHKANDRFFRALARLLKEHDIDAHCSCIDSGADRERTKSLVHQLGIADKVTFLPILSPVEIRDRYQSSDIIADEYVVGSFGLITLEALSCGRAVVSYYDKELSSRYYPDEPPVLWAHTESQILEQLLRASGRAFRRRHAEVARAWILRHHAPDRVAEDLIELYSSIVPSRSFKSAGRKS